MDIKIESPLRPSQYVEHKVVTSILEGTYPPGSTLPNERTFASKMGVTRPTLRETLHRLSKEGWVTIRHGKPTLVNDYWEKGGMGLLSTMSKYIEYLPRGFVTHLLEVRAGLMPVIARVSVEKAPEIILAYLSRARSLKNTAESFSHYDWELQILMADQTGNPVYRLILNDFSSMFEILAIKYFSIQKARDISRNYYIALYDDIREGESDIEGMVHSTMEKSVEIWKGINGTKA